MRSDDKPDFDKPKADPEPKVKADPEPPKEAPEITAMMAIAEQIASGFRQLADHIPAAQPLLRVAAVIDMHVARVRALTEPPPPVEGPQPDHS